jgi:hypothetical protein
MQINRTARAMSLQSGLLERGTGRKKNGVFLVKDSAFSFRLGASSAAYSKIMSSTVWPPGIIGKTCSWYGTWTSSKYGPLYSIISRIADSRSDFMRTVAAPQP